jgi:hypothetical protein
MTRRMARANPLSKLQCISVLLGEDTTEPRGSFRCSNLFEIDRGSGWCRSCETCNLVQVVLIMKAAIFDSMVLDALCSRR